MMYGAPPEFPRATRSPTIILLVSGLTGLLGFLVGFFAGLGTGETSAAPAPRVTVTVEQPAEPTGSQPPAIATTGPPATTPPATSAPPGAPAGNRTLVVGVDIQPGTYRTAGPAAGQPVCYWARLKSTTARASDIIAADMPQGAATVTIAPTDKAFQTGGCAEWTRA
ncbi:hypothetical protein [Nonomuraea cavernae]|uniref:hypothetical protein n=1 Tax=Nonomuraea cavernae TaxID=2045107 RepID=UPI00166D636B|nr:hypothetical protein [Nonomuraea cavernae]MCA2190354.1 hypothetical protein [Nonomuraea cavernae]